MTQVAQRALGVYLASRGIELPAWRCTTHRGRSARGHQDPTLEAFAGRWLADALFSGVFER